MNGAIKITVQENTKIGWNHICSYYEKWEDDEDFNSLIYSNFVRKFLEDVEYRKGLEVSGNHWLGVLPYTDKSGVNAKCAKKIKILNNKKEKNLKFKDFAELKTYGLDKYSQMKYEDLIEFVEEDALKKIENEFFERKLVVRALRWNARGLKPQLCIRRVKTELKIEENKKKSKKYKAV